MAPANAINRMIDNIAVHMFALDFAYIFYHTRVVVVIMDLQNFLDASLVLDVKEKTNNQPKPTPVNSLYRPITLFDMWKDQTIDKAVNAIVLGVWGGNVDKHNFTIEDIEKVFDNTPKTIQSKIEDVPRFIRSRILAKLAEYIVDKFPTGSTIKDANMRYLHTLLLYKSSDHLARIMPTKTVKVNTTTEAAQPVSYSPIIDTEINQGYMNGFVNAAIITNIKFLIEQNTLPNNITAQNNIIAYIDGINEKYTNTNTYVKMSNFLNRINTNNFKSDNEYNIFVFYICIVNSIQYISKKKIKTDIKQAYDIDIPGIGIQTTIIQLNTHNYVDNPNNDNPNPILDFSDEKKKEETITNILNLTKYRSIMIMEQKKKNTKNIKNVYTKNIYNEIIKGESDNTRIAYLIEYIKLLKENPELTFTII